VVPAARRPFRRRLAGRFLRPPASGRRYGWAAAATTRISAVINSGIYGETPAPEFLNAIAEDGVAAAIAAYRAEWKKRGHPRRRDHRQHCRLQRPLWRAARRRRQILALNTEAWPSSSNTWDSLSDAYLTAGDRAKAIEVAKKANALLAEEKGLTPERRAAIQGNIDTKPKPQ
jgi:hypothetical protein